MQMVPTMFVRLLALPDAVRKGHDLSSLQKIVHAAAPCPVEIKHRMIEWLGPIIYEYYGGSGGKGSSLITAPEGLETTEEQTLDLPALMHNSYKLLLFKHKKHDEHRNISHTKHTLHS